MPNELITKRRKTYQEMSSEELEALDPNFAGVKEKLEGLKELGLDISTLEDKIEWAVKARQIMGTVKSK